MFPVSFFASLQPLLRNTGGLEAKASLEKAWKIVSAYDEDVWRSSLILIPAGFTDHWVLVAVCNAKDSRPRELGPYSPKATSPNSLKTDGEPFCILTLDSLDNTPLCISQVVSTYLEYHYGVMHNADLQVVNTWVAKVRLCSHYVQPCTDAANHDSARTRSTSSAADCTRSITPRLCLKKASPRGYEKMHRCVRRRFPSYGQVSLTFPNCDLEGPTAVQIRETRDVCCQSLVHGVVPGTASPDCSARDRTLQSKGQRIPVTNLRVPFSTLLCGNSSCRRMNLDSPVPYWDCVIRDKQLPVQCFPMPFSISKGQTFLY